MFLVEVVEVVEAESVVRAARSAESESDEHDVIVVDSTPIPTSTAAAATLLAWDLSDGKMLFTVKSCLSIRFCCE